MTCSVGIDIGGTNLKAVAIASDGTILQRLSRVTESKASGPVDWAACARQALDELINLPRGEPVAIGICAPGLAARDGRSIAHLPGKLRGLAGIDWTQALGAAAIVPVLNDAHAALIGEAWIGAARDRRDVVMLTLGTGVGGAVISDGRLLRGAMGRAGHIGHLSLDPDGPVSITGMPGAVEMMVGDCTVADRSAGKFASTAALVAAHGAGDSEATRIWRRSLRALGCTIASCINLFDPELVVIGGGIALAGEALFEPLAAELDRVEWRPGGHRVPVVSALLGEWAGAIGAARNSFP